MYGKLFVSMYDGSIYGKWEAIVTFQQLIILADKDGTIEMTPQALSARTSIPIEIINKGIELLESPDPTSRTPDEEGRRIVRIAPTRPWGWHITNYAKYRAIRTAEERREYHKQYWHKRKNKNQPDSTGTQQNQPIVEVEVNAEVTKPSKSNDLDFDIFWRNYPKKVDKKKARVAFNNLKIKDHTKAIGDCKTRYQGVAKCYVPNPTTYIHGERWNDEVVKKEEKIETNIEALAKQKGLSPKRGESQIEWEQRVRNTR